VIPRGLLDFLVQPFRFFLETTCARINLIHGVIQTMYVLVVGAIATAVKVEAAGTGAWLSLPLKSTVPISMTVGLG